MCIFKVDIFWKECFEVKFLLLELPPLKNVNLEVLVNLRRHRKSLQKSEDF